MTLRKTELRVGHSYLMLLLTGALTICVAIGLLFVLTDRIDDRVAADTQERFELTLEEWQGAL